LIFAEPSSVGISISPPSAAVVKLIGISQCRSLWSRWKTVRLEVHHHVEVAGRAAVDAGLAFARQADAVALVDAGRDLHRQRLVLLHAPGAAARAAGIGITLPLPWQRGQVCWIEKKPCCMRTWPWPPQVGQVFGLVPGLAPLPWQVSHSSMVGMRMRVSVPRAASSSEISRL
jgi:hypothetical protein